MLMGSEAWVCDLAPNGGLLRFVGCIRKGSSFVIGGTSASCPMFWALWTIAAQHAHRPLGQDAAITDVVNSSSSNNVTGAIHDPFGVNPIRAAELAAPLYHLPSFISALFTTVGSPRAGSSSASVSTPRLGQDGAGTRQRALALLTLATSCTLFPTTTNVVLTCPAHRR